MTLEDLIKQLQTAMELAPEVPVEWRAVEDQVHDPTWVICGACLHPTAQAIAIRHNLSAEVLRLLEELADWRRADGLGEHATPAKHQSFVLEQMAATSHADGRATKAESELAALKAKYADDYANAYKMGRDYVAANDCEEDPDV